MLLVMVHKVGLLLVLLVFNQRSSSKLHSSGNLLQRFMRQEKESESFALSHIGLILLPAALIMIQPDLGSTVIMIVSAFAVLFMAGYPLRFFTYIGVAGVGAFVALIAAAPYRLDRIKSYIDPWNDPLGTGFQGIQSIFAIAPGGLFGHGYGNSRQKYLYLPEPQNDFIFSIIAEESGFIGATSLYCYSLSSHFNFWNCDSYE